jgi:hypothetical protein
MVDLALRTFFSSGLDRLYMGSFLIEKRPSGPDPGLARPGPTEPS